jgi:hypothetical protein
MFVDVVQVVTPLPEKGRIGVEGCCGSFCFGVRQVIGQPGLGRILRHRRGNCLREQRCAESGMKR